MIYILDISDVNEEDYNIGYSLASQNRQKKARRFSHRNQKIICIFTELLLKYALKEKGFSQNNPEYRYNKNGKPYLANSDIFFNNSHSKNMICTVVSDSEIGCDIEKIRGIKKNIFKRIFPKLSADTMTERELIGLWTRLESCIKLRGESIFTVLDGDISLTSYNFYEIDEVFGYHITVCSEKKIDNIVIKRPGIRDILAKTG